MSLGGNRVRVMFSNEYASQPLVIGAAHVALCGSGAGITPGSDHALTFAGHPSITVPPGAPIVSDPVDLPSAYFTDERETTDRLASRPVEGIPARQRARRSAE